MTNAELIAKIKAEIDKRYAEYNEKKKTDDFTYYEGMADALDLFEQFIDSLESEKPIISGDNLESAIDSFWNTASGYQPKFVTLEVKKDGFEKIARHFYDLGCRRTAEKYDEIEYNRQRAEEHLAASGKTLEINPATRLLSTATRLSTTRTRTQSL